MGGQGISCSSGLPRNFLQAQPVREYVRAYVHEIGEHGQENDCFWNDDARGHGIGKQEREEEEGELVQHEGGLALSDALPALDEAARKVACHGPEAKEKPREDVSDCIAAVYVKRGCGKEDCPDCAYCGSGKPACHKAADRLSVPEKAPAV